MKMTALLIMINQENNENYLYGWPNKPPSLALKSPSRLFKYHWASLTSKEGAIKKTKTIQMHIIWH